MINVSGRKVNPAEIERVLKLSPRVREAVVLGLPVQTRGEEVTACVAGEATEGRTVQTLLTQPSELAGAKAMALLETNSAERGAKSAELISERY